MYFVLHLVSLRFLNCIKIYILCKRVNFKLFDKIWSINLLVTHTRIVDKNFTGITVEEVVAGFGSNLANCSGYAGTSAVGQFEDTADLERTTCKT